MGPDAKAGGYQNLIDKAATERERLQYERAAQDLQARMRFMRTYPDGKILRWSAIVAVMLPWAILARDGHSVRGLIAGAVVAFGLIALAVRHNRSGRRPTCNSDEQ